MGAESTEVATDMEAAINELEDAIKSDDKKDIISQEEIFAKTAADHVQKEFLSSQLNNYQVIRRNGKVTAFDTTKISIALTKALLPCGLNFTIISDILFRLLFHCVHLLCHSIFNYKKILYPSCRLLAIIT